MATIEPIHRRCHNALLLKLTIEGKLPLTRDLDEIKLQCRPSITNTFVVIVFKASDSTKIFIQPIFFQRKNSND
jgi:hypothetical protein